MGEFVEDGKNCCFEERLGKGVRVTKSTTGEFAVVDFETAEAIEPVLGEDRFEGSFESGVRRVEEIEDGVDANGVEADCIAKIDAV